VDDQTRTFAMVNHYQADKSCLYTVKKRLSVFQSPAGISLTKLSLDGIKLLEVNGIKKVE